MTPSRPIAARRTSRVLLAGTAALTLTLGACGAEDSADTPSAADTGGGDVVDTVEVTAGADDDTAPTVAVKDLPLAAPGETQSRILSGADGKDLPDDALVDVDLALYNGKDGSLITGSETYSQQPVMLDLGQEQVLPGIVKALRDAKEGSTGVAAIPPKDLFGDAGQPQLGIGKDDTVLAVYAIRGVVPPAAQGEEVPAKKGLPTVAWKDDAAATITMPKGEDPPSKLVVQPLVEGGGEKVKKGDSVAVTYTGALWKNGKVFDSSFTEGRGPFAFTIGDQRVIAGWDEGLVGQRVGSRVLLVVPPEEGYGSKGSPDGGIGGKDTIVFVVDILKATPAAG